MEKMRMESLDMTAQNIEKIGALFPNCITETVDENGKPKKAINFDLLKQMLSGDLIEGSEAYEFTWVGKKAAIVEANKPIRKTLRPCKEESVNWDTTENLYIEGDNLEVLKLLQESYLGAVKMIYIDPPYNTGKDCFMYPDNFSMDIDEYEDAIGIYDEENNVLFKENNITNPRFHSAWCSMIYSRLMLSRNLLTEDGAIFISIDDSESENLKKICDEVFGAANYVNTISANMKNIAGASGGGEDKRLKKNCEFILVYAKNYEVLKPFGGVYTYTEMHEVVEQYCKDGKNWHYTSVLVDAGEKVYAASTVDGDGNEIKIYRRPYAIIKSVNQIMKDEGLTEKEVYYKYGTGIFEAKDAQSSIRTRVISAKKDNSITDDVVSIEYIPKTGRNKGQLYEQFYKGEKCRLFAWLRDISEIIDGVLYKKDTQGTYWDLTSYINNLTKEGDITFPNGKKPIALIERMITMQSDTDSLILDFFSGSASTAHAVMQSNLSDSGNRKFIMVQYPEKCEEDKEFSTICEIGKERIRRAGTKIKEESPLTTLDLDVGFRVFKLDDTNMTDVYYAADEYTQDLLTMLESNIKPDRTDLDLLFGCLLEWGLPLSLPYTSEQIEGCTVHTYNDGDLIACFDEDIPDSVIKTIAKKQPLRAVFRDSSFANSPSKINVGEVFKLLAPDTRVKVI